MGLVKVVESGRVPRPAWCKVSLGMFPASSSALVCDVDEQELFQQK